MNSSFDLSPVIDLLRALPSRPSTVNSPSESYTDTCFKPNQYQRQLGDFTSLWQFLDRTADVGASPPGLSSTPEPLIPAQSQTSPKKPRRIVTFAATVGLSDDIIGSVSGKGTTELNTDSGVKPFVEHVARPAIKPSATPEARKIQLIQLLMAMFPEARHTLLKPAGSTDLTPDGIHVFVDNSNILIGFYNHIKKVRGFNRSDAVRRPAFCFHNLSLILERGRGIAKKALVGSSPITPAVLEARELGYETSILERVEKERAVSSASSGSESAASSKRRRVEQSVDELLALKILETILDYAPSTIVLASGDGAEGEYSPGFFRVVERCLNREWNVELVAFKRSLSGVYKDKEFRKKWKGRFRFVPLDGFVEHLLG